MKRATLLALCLTLAAPALAHADLPSWLRKRNSDVVDGNELLGQGDAKAALEAYDRAARELPNDAGVQLNRGLALLKLGELGKAKEALLTASGPAGSSDVRADAYRNLALAFYREGDALAGQQKHQDAQKAFREAVDAAKRSLRLRPGDPNAAWNLELAARRMREEEAKHKEEQEKQKQDQQNQDQQNQDQQENQDGQPQDGEQDQDGQPQDGQKPPEEQKNQDQAKKPEPPKDKAADDAKKQAEANKAKEGKKEEAGEPEPGEQDKALPSDVAHALDALQDGEENFERVRARQRAQQERRAPEKDW